MKKLELKWFEFKVSVTALSLLLVACLLVAQPSTVKAQAVFVPSVPADVGLKGLYSVSAYGAKGDGTTDDTAAVQSAINACEAAGGGEIYFPAGTFKVSQASGQTYCLLVNTNNVLLKGVGTASRIARNTAGCNTLDIQRSATISTSTLASDHIAVKDLYFNPLVASTAGDTEIVCPYTRHLVLRDLMFGQIDQLQTLASAPTIASNCYSLINVGSSAALQSTAGFFSHLRAFGYTNFITAVNYVDMTWDTWDGDSNQAVCSPIIVGTGVEAIRAINGDLVDSAGVIPAQAGANYANMAGASMHITGRVRFCTFTSWYFDTTQIGVLADTNAGAGSIAFHNCWFSPRPGAGILWNSGNNSLQCVGCQFENIGAEGIRVLGGSGNQFIGNQFIATGVTTSVPSIYIGAGVTGAIVQGNYTNSSLAALGGGNASLGLFIDPLASNVIVTGNDFGATSGLINGNYNAPNVTLAANLPLFNFQDNFTGPAGSNLSAHLATKSNNIQSVGGEAQAGQSWSAVGSSQPLLISSVSDVYCSAAGTGEYVNAQPVGAASAFDFTFTIKSDISGSIGALYQANATADTGYNLRYSSGGGINQSIQLYRFSAGAATLLSQTNGALVTGHTYTVKCFVSGTSTKSFTGFLYDLSAQGVRSALFGGTVTDSSPLPTTGLIGIRGDGASGDQTGFHFDNEYVYP